MRLPLLATLFVAVAHARRIPQRMLPDYNKDVCGSIKNTTTIEIALPMDKEYQEERLSYHSTAARSRTPSCVLYPYNPDQVRGIMTILSQSDQNFAIKAGGSNQNDLFSSVDNGPLISLRKMNHVILDTESGQIDLGPGAIWNDVIPRLEGTGWMLPTPRFGQIGVGGYLTGGGLSFYTQQYGWGASSILEMQVVLANGSMAIANHVNHADLYRAIRGGGNRYGIVTSFHMQGFKQGIVWGGVMLFHRDEYVDRRILTAVREFTQYNSDPKASIMLKARRIYEDKLDIWVLHAFYDGRQMDWTIKAATLFQAFLFLDPYRNTCRDRSYSDLIKENDRFVTKDRITVIGTETIPNPPNAYRDELLVGIYNHWRSVVDMVQILPGMISEISYTPLTHQAARAAHDRGHDMLDMETKHHDRIIIEASFSFFGHKVEDLKPIARYDEMQKRINDLIKNVTDATWDITQDMVSDGDIKGMYVPLLMNSAGTYQDFYERLRLPGQQFARDMVADYDPNQVFRRTGGFEVPKV